MVGRRAAPRRGGNRHLYVGQRIVVSITLVGAVALVAHEPPALRAAGPPTPRADVIDTGSAGLPLHSSMRSLARRVPPPSPISPASVPAGAGDTPSKSPAEPTSGPAADVGDTPATVPDDPEGREPSPAATTATPLDPESPPTPAPVPSFPDASTTGVPRGTVLRPSGSLEIRGDGTIIDGLEITGTVTVHADDVVIRNSLIRNTGNLPVRLLGNDLLIEDTEIDGQGHGVPAVGYNDYVLRRVNIHNVAEGPRIAGGDVVIEDSYIHHLVQVGDNHTDAIQAVGGDGIVIRRNTILAYNPDTGTMGNAAFMFGEEDGPLYDCLVQGNLLDGGNYTVNGGGGGGGARCTFRDNRFVQRNTYGAAGNLSSGVVWDSSNVWHETGRPVR